MPGIVFEVDTKAKIGFAASATLTCKSCKSISNEGYLCQRIGQSKSQNVPFDINMRAVLAFRGVGCGYFAIKEWGSIMDMPFIPSQDTYTKMHNRMEKAATATFKSISQQSRDIIANAYEEIGVHEDEHGILDIAVSYDGTWQKRGHTSHNGAAAVIDLLTGLPIDYEVLSNYCSKCTNEDDEAADPEWKARHAESCSRNFDGSAGSMEVECAKRIWQRSVSENRLRYTVMLCDGDSKAFDAVSSLNLYGAGNKVIKEDCINHVAKRMGTALMNIISESKVQKDAIGGKGKLTQAKIKKIQNYYGRAIKDYSNDIPLLKKRIMAILFHLSSTDDTPKHVHCPPGERSWCFWQRAVAKAEQPPSHKDHETLPPEIGKRLVPIFIRLSDEKLLKRCARKATQNPNESLHQLTWKICPKSTYVGRRTVQTATALALSQFSMGATFKALLFKILEMEPGRELEASSHEEKNKKRIVLAEKASSFKSKAHRKNLKYQKVKANEKKKNSEGQTYTSGGFNN